MARYYFGVDQGGGPRDVVEGDASPGKSVELSIELTHGLTSGEIISQMEMIKNVIATGPWLREPAPEPDPVPPESPEPGEV